MSAEVYLYEPDFGKSGQFGRDFRSEPQGFGRMEILPIMTPTLKVELLDAPHIVDYIPGNSQVELVDVITDDDSAEKTANILLKRLDQ